MEPMVQMSCGALRGRRTETGIDAYLGVRYAVAGRWEYPQPVTHWDGVYDATRYGPAAMQQDALVPEVENGRPPFYYHEFREGLAYTYDEDCQYLNIFAPVGAQKSPVIVYIHGGGFLSGSSWQKSFDNPAWPRQGVVAVTLNYRLGLFGFADLKELEQEAGHAGNYALYDQLAALQWVKANIAAFGGDPDNITLMGQSAGARSVQMLVGSPQTQGLVHRAVMSSGGGVPCALFAKPAPRQEVRGFWQAWQTACGAASLDELRALPAAALLRGFGQMFAQGFETVIGAVSPYYDGFAFPVPGSDPALPGGWLEIPYLCGGNSEDMIPTLHLDAAAWAGKQPRASYAYYFSRQLPGDDAGAFHSADLWYWFGTLDNAWRPFTERDRELARQMTGYLTQFARTGDPNSPGLPRWNSAAEGKLLHLGDLDTEMAAAATLAPQNSAAVKEEPRKMAKTDLHVHCDLQRRELDRANPRDPLDCYMADARELRVHLEGQGIGRAVVMSGGEGGGTQSLAVSNERCHAIAQAHPDFFSWMCNFDPVSPETLPDRMAACKAQGAVGVGELMVNQWMDSPFLTALFAAAETLELPVTFHMSPEPGFSYGICDRPGLPLLEQTLRRFPKLKLLGHSQVFWLELSADCPSAGNKARSAMGRGPVAKGGRVPALLREYPNLYGDLSAYSGSCAILRDEAHGLAFLEEFSDRLFFATDTVNRHQTFPLAAFLDQCRADGRLSRQAWENICYKNAQRIFGV